MLTWTYSYTGDDLTSVCSPVDTSGCTTYGYTPASLYQEQVLDRGPQSYWPLSESSGTTAASAVIANEGADDGTYTDVTLGQAGPLPVGNATSASFNGTGSYVKLPLQMMSQDPAPTIAMWFKTSSPGVLFSYSDSPIASPAGTVDPSGNTQPALYVGTDGKLNGAFIWSTLSTPTEITTSSAVDDGNWHQVVLSNTGSTTTMWLDGTKVGSETDNPVAYGLVPASPLYYDNVYIGAGYNGSEFPDEQYSNTSEKYYSSFFNGDIADVMYTHDPLNQSDVTALYGSATRPADLLTSVTSAEGRTYATVGYDANTGMVQNVTDNHGGSWNIGAPTTVGSSDVYRSSVLAADPLDYWRFGDPAGTATASDEVKGGTAAYGNVTLGGGGAFADATAATFDGSTSQVALPADLAGESDETVGLWFKTTATNGVLFSFQANPLSAGTVSGNYSPALYVGSDGKLLGEFWDSGGASGYVETPSAVNDGKWHSVVFAVGTDSQSMYLDGNRVGTYSGTVSASIEPYVSVGAGFLGGHWPDESHYSSTANTGYATYFNGSIGDVAVYHSQLSGQQVSAQYQAAKNSFGVSAIEVEKVTDPGGKTLTYEYDPMNGYRQVAYIDGLGHKTTYGYDTGGYLHTVTDPDGDVTITGHDVRGNQVSKTTCQDQAAQECSTTYWTYLPDDTSATLTPSPTNDLVSTVLDGRSASATDITYRTSYTYDSTGDKTSVTTPGVQGFWNGRTTTISYTDGKTIAAADTGYAPAGLPYQTVSPGGATTTITYFHDGDVASVTDADGMVTDYTYDNLGRVLTQKQVSDSYPSGLTTSYTYDGAGDVLTETDPGVTDHVTGAIHTKQTTRVYDADGNVTSQTVADLTGGDASRTTTYSYNDLDEVESTKDPDSNETTYTYDGYGNKIGESDADGKRLQLPLRPQREPAHSDARQLHGRSEQPDAGDQPGGDVPRLRSRGTARIDHRRHGERHLLHLHRQRADRHDHPRRPDRGEQVR
jgi:YD repeat-containing protein